eukprot:g2738.t1
MAILMLLLISAARGAVASRMKKEELFKRLDTNADGVLSADEFIKMEDDGERVYRDRKRLDSIRSRIRSVSDDLRRSGGDCPFGNVSEYLMVDIKREHFRVGDGSFKSRKAYRMNWGEIVPDDRPIWSGRQYNECFRIDTKKIIRCKRNQLECAVSVGSWPALAVATSPTTWQTVISRIDLNIPGHVAARQICTQLLISNDWTCPLSTPGDRGAVCDWAARRAIAHWRFVHIFEEDDLWDYMSHNRVPSWMGRLQDVQPLHVDGIEMHARDLCATMLATDESGSFEVDKERSAVGDVARFVPGRHEFCQIMTASALYDAMERAVADRIGQPTATLPIDPDPSFHQRDITHRDFEREFWSQTDAESLSIVRANVARFLREAMKSHCISRRSDDQKSSGNSKRRVLEIGAQSYSLLSSFSDSIVHETLDIDPNGGATHTADITQHTGLSTGTFDCIIFTEVLEHTRDPVGAVAEIRRLLAPAGVLLMSTPLNLRLHGPFPDAWRLTEWGYKDLLVRQFGFHIVELRALEASRRPLFPVHYTAIARRGREMGNEGNEL